MVCKFSVWFVVFYRAKTQEQCQPDGLDRELLSWVASRKLMKNMTRFKHWRGDEPLQHERKVSICPETQEACKVVANFRTGMMSRKWTYRCTSGTRSPVSFPKLCIQGGTPFKDSGGDLPGSDNVVAGSWQLTRWCDLSLCWIRPSQKRHRKRCWLKKSCEGGKYFGGMLT